MTFDPTKPVQTRDGALQVIKDKLYERLESRQRIESAETFLESISLVTNSQSEPEFIQELLDFIEIERQRSRVNK